MMKNVADVVFGGFTYWLFGFGLSFGKLFTTPFFAVGSFAVDADIDKMGINSASFVI